MIFEVTTTTLQRWLVEIETPEKGHPALQIAQSRLDGFIQDGEILNAKVPHTMGDEFPWRINAAHIVAYEPSDEEIKVTLDNGARIGGL